jgi:hypothetical protein
MELRAMADSYVKDAFWMPQNLIGLGVGAVAVIALPFHGALLLGAAVAEAIYLRTMSSNRRFQRAIKSRRGR